MHAWRGNPGASEYYSASLEQRIAYAFYYLALAGFLAIMAFDVHEMLDHAAANRHEFGHYSSSSPDT